MPQDDPILARFLRPSCAAGTADNDRWQASGTAETPGEDARCRIFLNRDEAGRLQAAFAAFGPPAVIAAGDWICECVTGQTGEFTRTITSTDVENALSLSPTQRYAGLVAVDALTNAMSNLET